MLPTVRISRTSLPPSPSGGDDHRAPRQPCVLSLCKDSASGALIVPGGVGDTPEQAHAHTRDSFPSRGSRQAGPGKGTWEAEEMAADFVDMYTKGYFLGGPRCAVGSGQLRKSKASREAPPCCPCLPAALCQRHSRWARVWPCSGVCRGGERGRSGMVGGPEATSVVSSATAITASLLPQLSPLGRHCSCPPTLLVPFSLT